MKGVIEATVHTIRTEQGEVKRSLDDLYKEVHTLRVEAQKEKKAETARRPKGSPERVGIFVDVQNMFYAARQYGARLDFEKLLQAAVGDRRLIKAVAYVIQTPEVDQTGFVTMLQQRSYQVRRKDLRLRSDGSAKGDWDMGMAIDMIGIADKLDIIVLVSGDGDFVALVNLLKEIGPRVEVFSFPHNTARDLMEVADRYYAIDEGLLIKMDRLASTDGEREKLESQ
ncbi:MAG: NYN domain-containing protein [Candidatus Latescibacteria bacterium]|nr:NYN domain-containing protein [Candidatus Latescibacterota bacterium]